MATTTIYQARRIITMNPANPEGTAVAVRGDRVLGVGTVEELAAWGDHVVDDRFADNVLCPGFIEAHSHSTTGGDWTNAYVGFFDRRAPDGQVWSGCHNIGEVVARLVDLDEKMRADGAPDDELLMAWGLDPLYFGGERMYASHLDQVSLERPIFVHHASHHLATVNSALMAMEGITADSSTPGVAKGVDGQPNGELQEPSAMQLAVEGFGRLLSQRTSPEALWNYGYEARNTGTTLVVDLASGALDEESLGQWQSVVDEADFPCRVMLTASGGWGVSVVPDDHAKRTAELVDQSSDKLRFGLVKLILDGSIQGFTARISWPYYYDPPADNPENGLWLTAPEQMPEQMPELLMAYHRRGLTVHCHCNGDQATEAYLDAVEQVLEEHPRWDHRHTVQHCQLTTKAQYKRMAALGMCANIFTNHIFYWGDQHRDSTVGPERARGMDACGTALREGVSFSIHSDSSVTPLGQLHTMWCAVNRLTASGDVLGADERISVPDALHAVTLGSAYQIKMDHEMGSIEAGKLADFAVLEDDPLTVDPLELKNIGVWGTVVGGVPYEASAT